MRDVDEYKQMIEKIADEQRDLIACFLNDDPEGMDFHQNEIWRMCGQTFAFLPRVDDYKTVVKNSEWGELYLDRAIMTLKWYEDDIEFLEQGNSVEDLFEKTRARNKEAPLPIWIK